MPTNPFEPPESHTDRSPREPAGPRSPFSAVMLGLLVDVGGSLAVGIVASVAYARQLHDEGMPDDQIREAMQAIPHDSALYMGALLVGIALSVLGGYVCARVARTREYRAGLMLAATSALFSLVLGGSSDGAGMTALLTVTGIACNLLGVKFGADHNRRVEAPSA